MKTLYVVTAPSGYWENVSSSHEGAQSYMDRYFPPNWKHGYSIKVWEAFPVTDMEGD